LRNALIPKIHCTSLPVRRRHLPSSRRKRYADPVTTNATLDESNFASLDAMMSAYAEQAVRLAWSDHRRRLDLSESSIDQLEQILAGQAAEDLEFQTRLWGSYFGEVIRRRFAGEWELAPYPGGGVAVVPTLLVRGSRLYPLIKVYRRLTLGEGENLCAFYKMVSGRLGEPSKEGDEGVL
jgi:hypothetical protein